MGRWGAYKLFAGFVAVYVLVVIIMPSNPATMAAYHLDSSSYRVLLLATLGIPSFLTWFAAFYGYEQLRRYNKMVQASREGPAFGLLTKGSHWLALYLPVASLIGLILGAIANKSDSFRGPATVIANYAVVLLALTAMAAFSGGGSRIAKTINARPAQSKIRLVTFIFVALGVFYCYVVVRHGIVRPGSYHLPIGWLLVTLVVPLFYAWIMGIMAVLDLDAYAGKVKGILYQKAIHGLSVGILTIIIGAILLQYVSSVNPNSGRLILGGLLLLRYVLYACLAIGFGLIGTSAKKLQQIEQI